MRNTFFKGCQPEIVAGPDGSILAVGRGAGAIAGRDAEIIEVPDATTLAGLHDSHLHLEWLALRKTNLEVQSARTRRAVLAAVAGRAAKLPAQAWIVGRGWYNDDWRDDSSWPTRAELDRAGGGRPVFLTRKDGHSAWLSTAALRATGVTEIDGNPAAGVIDREPDGFPAGTLRESAVAKARSRVPQPTEEQFDAGMLAALRDLSRKGITSVHTMDTPRGFRSLERLDFKQDLPVRVTWNLPADEISHAERLGLRSGWGGGRLRIWGLKAFLDGSLGSRTAEMLDGGGVPILPQDELVDLVQRAAAAELNVCLHAIGDKAVRRALDALEPLAGAWSHWRPRIEHVQCCHPDDWVRFRRSGTIASMQPLHAVADREMADREWPLVTSHSYAWRGLEKAGATLAFGSDAPVEDASPLLGIDAATSWRRRARWFPEQALSRTSAIRAYTLNAAFSVGTEKTLGSLAPGKQCDLTFIAGEGPEARVLATVVAGRITWRRA